MEAYTPYIVAFPGERYYEFDMSGKFQPKNSGENHPQLNAQLVTFISKEKAEVGVTDDMVAIKAAQAGNYSYIGAFMESENNGRYVMDAAGSAFVQEGAVMPFRGYIQPTSSGAQPRRILIGSAGKDEEPTQEISTRGLTIYGRGETIFIESTLEYEAIVTIYSLSGQIVKRLTVQPMTKEVVPVSSRGVYIVNNKKIAVL